MHRSKKSVIISGRQKGLLYTISALIWVSGAVWLYLQQHPRVEAVLGPESHPAQALWMKLHGAAAMVFLLILGALLQQHVPAGWSENRQRPSGVLMLGSCLVLIVTGWGLYYLGGETLRQVTSAIHSWLGLALPVILLLHVWGSQKKP